MVNDFNSLRRRLGVVTLVLECMLTAFWVSGLNRFYEVYVPYGESSMAFVDWYGGALMLGRGIATSDNYYGKAPSWMHWPGPASSLEEYLDTYEWTLEIGDLRFGHRTDLPSQVIEINMVFIPLWYFVIPLTLLSTWLLLSKPRTKPEPQTTSPSENA